VVAAVPALEIVSYEPVTVTSSATFEAGITASSLEVCAALILTEVSSVWKPCSSNRTLYSPGGRNVKM
jgi:hypothetical protein